MYRVVIVEDDPMVASINRQYIENTPFFQVQAAFKQGGEALQYLQENEADLVVLDYYTPLMTGMEFVDRLHGMGKTPSVIMVTSAGDAQIVSGMLARGVLDYLVKPFEYCRFRQALEKFCRVRGQMDTAKTTLSQEEIDRLLVGPDKPAAPADGLAKGLNECTLELIRRFMRENKTSRYTSEQIAEQVHLSRITIRRYMNYMLETHEIRSAIDYQTGGRPSVQYQYG